MAQPQPPYRSPQRVPPRRPAVPNRRAYGVTPRRRSTGCGLLALALLALMLVGGVYIGTRVFGTITKISSGIDVRPDEIADGPPPALLQEPFNVLVIGVDLRADHLDDGARSDTLIVVRVDPLQKWASMLSIPRDTLATIPSQICGGELKINAAYACGYSNPEATYGAGTTPEDAGAALAAETVEDYLDLEIDYTAQIDFNGFKEIVDALGGITIDVPKDIVDNEYPTDDYGITQLYIPAGMQRMDGDTALKYARTRHADNDFGRAERQQQVIEAVLREMQQKGLLGQITSADNLLDVASANVHTTMTELRDPGTLRGLAALAQEIGPDRIQRLVLKPEEYADGKYSLWSDLSSAIVWDPEYVSFVARKFQTQPVVQAPGETPPTIQVQNGSGIMRVASQLTVDLDVAGYVTTTATDAPERIPNTVILNYSNRADVAQQLAEFLKVDPQYVRTMAPEEAPPDVDIIVRLGEDYPDLAGARSAQP